MIAKSLKFIQLPMPAIQELDLVGVLSMLEMPFWQVMKMEAVIEDFNKRVNEINSYLVSLEDLELYSLENDADDDFLRILQSNALLMIYNLVESTIMNGILKIYDDLFQNEITYTKVRKEIQDIWFSFVPKLPCF